ncbi:MAG: hypothetical protein KBD66_02550 [Candidatus Doudnabacteria bacterium]|nr:hypothetical protein [Candidatus Doudnabacteria bacterium]
MIFLQNNPLRTERESEAGVTLLLSVLLLSAITTIAFSLAAVGFSELATSDDLARTEPIFYHSLGIAEEATFGMKRQEPTVLGRLGSECAQSFTSYVIEPSSIVSKAKYCNLNPSKTIEVAVSKNAANSAVRIYAYDPASGGGTSNYTTLKLKKTTDNGATVELYACKLTEECSDLSQYPSVPLTGWSVKGTILYPNDTVTMDPAYPYEIVLVNATGPKEYVEITTAPTGLPYLNKEAIEIQSEYGRLIRRLRVLVPAQ